MTMMIGRTERGRALVKAVDSLNLQDLTQASDDQIKLVTDLVWEIKGLFHSLIKGKASDVLGNLNIGGGAKLSATLVADLTASIPRDAFIGAQQEWLPNLATEMANGPVTPPEKLPGPDAPQAIPEPIQPDAVSEATAETDTAEANAETDTAEAAAAKETLCAEKVAPHEDAAGESNIAEAEPDGGEETPSTDEQGLAAIKGRLPLPTGTPRAIKARIEDILWKSGSMAARKHPASTNRLVPRKKPRLRKRATKPIPRRPKSLAATKRPPPSEQPPDQPTDQFDDLLFPTREESGAIKTGSKDAEKAGQPEQVDDASKAEGTTPADAPPASNTAAATLKPRPHP